MLELRPRYMKRNPDRENITCTGPVVKTNLSSSRNGMNKNEEKGKWYKMRMEC